MKAKHTQGEWYAKKYRDSQAWRVCFSPSVEITVLHDVPNDVTDEEREANAKLIASAPALLEALIDIDKYCSKNLCTKHRCMITSAIKQATE